MSKTTNKIYQNYTVLAPTGELLFRCNFKKIRFYLTKNLATQISDTTIQLNFTPNGPGHSLDEFYCQERQNICCVCGSDQELTRHHVLPYCYRRYMNEIKSHSYHDILPLCESCHIAYEVHANLLKTELAILYNAPINGIYDEDLKKEIELTNRAAGYAKSLLNNKIKDKLPPDRIEYLLNTIREILHRPELTLEDLPNLDIQFRKIQIQITHGKLVAEQIKSDEYDAFAKLWRNHFLQTMNPQFMPKGWSADRTPERFRCDNP